MNTDLRQGTVRDPGSVMIDVLRENLRGEVIDRFHKGYDAARQVWNGLIDRHPLAIAQCTSTADVVQAVAVARRYRPVVSIRGGGHQVAGSAVVDDGLVIDLGGMRGVHVDPAARTVRAQAGATWGDVDRTTQLFGLATPGGEVSQTGIAGLTLGGGLGGLMRAYGLSCDNLRSLEIVTADGAVRTASREEHPDLFWAARGGGRGLGVVTSFEFGLHPVGPQVAVAQILYPYVDVSVVLRAWCDLTPRLLNTVTPEIVLWSVLSDPGLLVSLHGDKLVMVAGMFAGAATDGAGALAPMAELGTPLLDLSGTVNYVDAQSALDAAFPAGGRYYFKSHFLNELTDQAIDALLAADSHRPNPESLMVIRTLGGAISNVGNEDSAYPHRNAQYNLSVDASWSDAALDSAAIGWARESWTAMAPFATGGVYLNFAGLDHDVDRAAVFGSDVAQLDHIRQAYDPDGIFSAAAARP